MAKKATVTTHLDLRFQQLGRWFVLGKGQKTGHGQFWICQCVCNTQAQIHEAALVEGRAQSCGCDYVNMRGQRRPIDWLVGQQHGKWLVLGRADRPGQLLWDCICICKKSRAITTGDLTGLRTTQCRECAQQRRRVAKLHRWYGNWLVLECLGPNRRKRSMYRCKCRMCGRVKPVPGTNLVSGRSTSCGCGLRKRQEPIVGHSFGRLHILEHAGFDASHRSLYLCQCSCPEHTMRTVRGGDLRSGRTKGCGCLSRELSRERLIQRNIARTAPDTQFDFTLDIMRQHATQSTPEEVAVP